MEWYILHVLFGCKEIFYLYGFSREAGEGYVGEVCCVHYVVRKFSICKDFPERQGRDTWRGICCMHSLIFFFFLSIKV